MLQAPAVAAATAGAAASTTTALAAISAAPIVSGLAGFIPAGAAAAELTALSVQSMLQALNSGPTNLAANAATASNAGGGGSGNGPYYAAAVAGSLLVADSIKKLWEKKKPADKKPAPDTDVRELSEQELKALKGKIILTPKL